MQNKVFPSFFRPSVRPSVPGGPAGGVRPSVPGGPAGGGLLLTLFKNTCFVLFLLGFLILPGDPQNTVLQVPPERTKQSFSTGLDREGSSLAARRTTRDGRTDPARRTTRDGRTDKEKL